VQRLDLLIRGATVYDGSGADGVRADVGIRDDRIAHLGTREIAASAEIDASGLAVAPGFIDVHTHDDFAVLLHPDMEFKTRQGVTTNVVGNCGFGAAPHGVAALMAQAFHPGATLPEYTRATPAISSAWSRTRPPRTPRPWSATGPCAARSWGETGAPRPPPSWTGCAAWCARGSTRGPSASRPG
jgi:hypothetical protein